MCTPEDMLTCILGAPSIDDVMSFIQTSWYPYGSLSIAGIPRKDTLAHILGAPSFYEVMSYKLLTTL